MSLLWSSSRFAKHDPSREEVRQALYDAQIYALNQAAIQNPTLPRSMRILIWNTYKGQKSGWGHDVQRLLANIDLALLQEVSLSSNNSSNLKESGLFWSMGVGYYSRFDIPNGVATGSRASPLRTLGIASPKMEPFVKVNKIILATEYNIQGTSRTFLNINVHGINFVSSRTYRRQLEQAGPLIESHNGPLSFGGDLNMWSPTRREIIDEFAAAHGLKKVQFKRSGLLELDGVYVRDLNVESANIVSDIATSDHKPLILEVTVP